MTMTVDQLYRLPPMDLFIHWIRERHQVFLRRQAGLPKPWTQDPIIRTTFFTNVYRECDKVTRWYKQNIREPLKYNPAVLFATICFRWFNLPSTGMLLLGDVEEGGEVSNLLTHWDEAEAVDRLAAHRDAGNQIFTGAFNISNGGSTKPNVSRVCEDYLTPAWAACTNDVNDSEDSGWLRAEFLHGACEKKITLAGAHELLGELPGMGGSGFMAAQVVCDLKYTPYLKNAPDWWTWCSPGPGSKRGLNILLRRPVDGPVPKDWLEHINVLRETVHQKLPKYPKLHAQDLQNCLCEYAKYHHVLHGGRPKRKYPGANNS